MAGTQYLPGQIHKVGNFLDSDFWPLRAQTQQAQSLGRHAPTIHRAPWHHTTSVSICTNFTRGGGGGGVRNRYLGNFLQLYCKCLPERHILFYIILRTGVNTVFGIMANILMTYQYFLFKKNFTSLMIFCINQHLIYATTLPPLHSPVSAFYQRPHPLPGITSVSIVVQTPHSPKHAYLILPNLFHWKGWYSGIDWLK